MPLRAKLNKRDIFSFNYDETSWENLRNKSVYMDCCENRAVLKKSKLGTLFFSHYRKGNCTSAPESAEHIYLKNLISKIALQFGWNVVTEKQGKTPNGEKWIADVYCEKNNAKLVFEIQWSHQTKDEFIRRQKKYISSKVRAVWLFKLKNNKEYCNNDIPYQFDTPVFGMKTKSTIKNIYVPQFDKSIEEFIKGAIQGKLNWSPKKRQPLKVGLIPHYEHCWKCKKETGVILGISIKDKSDKEIDFQLFSDQGVPEFILDNLVSEHLLKNNIGQLKNRYSKTREEYYLSNGCFHCDAIMGNFFIYESWLEYQGNLLEAIYDFNFLFDKDKLFIKGEWYFDNKKSKHIF